MVHERLANDDTGNGPHHASVVDVADPNDDEGPVKHTLDLPEAPILNAGEAGHGTMELHHRDAELPSSTFRVGVVHSKKE